jgi:hypothetical protein
VSIYQACKTLARRGTPRFTGFFRVFLELRDAGFEAIIYILCFVFRLIQLVVSDEVRRTGHTMDSN